jgi:5-methylcytosine-specific restriction endonuclease McrA
MPCDYRNYPPNWKDIRAAILERAGHCCEECGVANYATNPATGSRVVLTIAHLDHDTTHNDPSNLKAWCQLHHLRFDAQYHAKHAAETRRRRLIEAGQNELVSTVARAAMEVI